MAYTWAALLASVYTQLKDIPTLDSAACLADSTKLISLQGDWSAASLMASIQLLELLSMIIWELDMSSTNNTIQYIPNLQNQRKTNFPKNKTKPKK